MFHLLLTPTLSPDAGNLKRALITVSRLFAILTLLSCVGAQSTYAQQPNKPYRLEQQLLGRADNRKVADATKFPLSAVVRLLVTFPDGTRAGGSGAVVGPNKILTAEHVAYNESRGGHFSSMEVILPSGYSATNVKSFTHGSHDGCHEGANCDYAVLTTVDSIGNQTGWFGMKQFDHEAIESVFIAGYPSDRGNGQQLVYVRAQAMHMHDSDAHNALSYLEWTAGGMSGGPIFTSDNYIVGIHTAGASEANYGIALCNQLFAKIREAKYR